MNSEAAAHCLIDGLFQLELCESAFCPEGLKDAAAVFHLNKRAGLTVAAAPQRGEFLAGLGGPLGRLEQVRYLDGQFASLGV